MVTVLQIIFPHLTKFIKMKAYLARSLTGSAIHFCCAIFSTIKAASGNTPRLRLQTNSPITKCLMIRHEKIHKSQSNIKDAYQTHYQHMNRGQSLNDFELNQKPDLINQPYCKIYNNKKSTFT